MTIKFGSRTRSRTICAAKVNKNIWKSSPISAGKVQKCSAWKRWFSVTQSHASSSYISL